MFLEVSITINFNLIKLTELYKLKTEDVRSVIF